VGTIREDFLASAGTAGLLLRDPALVAAWDRPSALAEFSVRGLAGHLAYQVFAVREALADPPPEQETVALLEHYRRVSWIGAPLDDDFNAGIRRGGEAIAAGGAAALADAYDEAVRALAGDLAGEPDRPVRMRLWGPWSLSLDDLLTTRMMELAVHGDDLAVSVGVPTPELPPGAIEAVVDLLSRLALRRHGQAAVLRALSRAERAPASIAAL
jgi:hypothetical protein